MGEKMSAELMQPVRGARDSFGKEKRKRDALMQLMRQMFEAYAYEPLETPALERMEALSSKYAGGEEIMKEIFKVQDQGGRELGLRYDLTVPLCRFFASNPKMPLPFKRYSISPVWRDGPLKAGRYREFWQCDADIIGAAGMLAEAEILALSCGIFESLFPGNFVIRLSNRKILDGIMETAGVGRESWLKATLAMDKLPKIGKAGVGLELEAIGIPKKSMEKILELISFSGGNAGVLEYVEGALSSEIGKEGVLELRQLLQYADVMGFGGFVQFTPAIARGLNYYTSSIFEAFLKEGKVASSIAAGGRYDELIGKFTGAAPVPAVGISFGLDVICEALLEYAPAAAASSLLVSWISKQGSENEMRFALGAASSFRKAGIPTCIDLLSRNPSKNLEFAAKKGFKFAAIVGERELKERKLQLKDLNSGESKPVSVEDAVSIIKKIK